jgi:hypothetical protein
MYISGKNKLQQEYEAAKRIPAKDRKLIVLNHSIAKQALQAPSMRHQYSRIAHRVPPEISHEDAEKTQTTTKVEESTGGASKKLRLVEESKKARQLAASLIDDVLKIEEEVIVQGKYDMKQLIY